MTAVVVALPGVALAPVTQVPRRGQLPTSIPRLADARRRRRAAAERSGRTARLKGYLAGMRAFTAGQRRELPLPDHERCIKRRSELIAALERSAPEEAKLAAELAALQGIRKP